MIQTSHTMRSVDEMPHRSVGRRIIRRLSQGAIGAGALSLVLGGLAGAASAASSPGNTQANVNVGSAIVLTGLPASFTLTGIVGATVTTGNTPVTMNVTTNNTSGYSVTVQSASGTLAGSVGNTESIPIGALSVRETGSPTYLPLSSTATDLVHTQASHSAAGGDTIRNDFQVVIPFVNSDTYSATLNYIATTL